jgi:cytochrome c biogenesis factor
VYWVCVIAIWVASMALAYALEIRDRAAAAVVVTAGMGVFVVLFVVFVVRSLKER